MKISITYRLFLYYLALCIATIFIISGYSYYTLKKSLLNRTFDQLITARVEKKNAVNRFFDDRRNDLNFLAGLRITSEILDLMELSDTHTAAEKISQLLDQFPLSATTKGGYFSDMEFYHTGNQRFYKKGSITIDSIGLNNPAIQYYLKNKSAFFLLDFIKPEPGGDPVMIVACQIKGKEEPPGRGLLILEMPVSSVITIMFENNPYNGLGQSGETYLVGPDLLMRSASRFETNSLLRTKVDTRASRAALKGGNGTMITEDYRGIRVLSSYEKLAIPGLNWVILSEIDLKEAMIPIYNLRNNLLFLSILISILLFGIVYTVSLRLTQPIRQLKKATDKIIKGDLNDELQVNTRDEIGELTDSFNKMTRELKNKSLEIESERIKRMTSVIDGQEMERKRLSRELHDGLGQLILAVKLRMERAREAEPEKTRQIISETSLLLNSVIQEIRTISNNLMPSVLDTFGLEEGLKSLCQTVENASGIRILPEIVREEDWKPALNKQLYIYRIVQEAMNNAVKYSRADTITVQVAVRNGLIVCEIRDNGVGFVYDRASIKGNGINNMKERAGLMEGSFDLQTGNKGTCIKIVIPNRN